MPLPWPGIPLYLGPLPSWERSPIFVWTFTRFNSLWGRADSRLVLSQWERLSQSNAASHWLGTNLESALWGLNWSGSLMADYIFLEWVIKFNSLCRIYKRYLSLDIKKLIFWFVFNFQVTGIFFRAPLPENKLTDINSLFPESERYGKTFKYVNLITDKLSIFSEIALRCIPQDFTDDKSTLVQLMTSCPVTSCHYLNQCWPSSMSP